MKLLRRRERSPSPKHLNYIERVDKPKRRLEFTALDPDKKGWLRRIFERFFNKQRNKIEQ